MGIICKPIYETLHYQLDPGGLNALWSSPSAVSPAQSGQHESPPTDLGLSRRSLRKSWSSRFFFDPVKSTSVVVRQARENGDNPCQTQRRVSGAAIYRRQFATCVSGPTHQILIAREIHPTPQPPAQKDSSFSSPAPFGTDSEQCKIGKSWNHPHRRNRVRLTESSAYRQRPQAFCGGASDRAGNGSGGKLQKTDRLSRWSSAGSAGADDKKSSLTPLAPLRPR